MFSWRLLDKMNDEEKKDDENDPSRHKFGYSSHSSGSSSFVSLSSPYRKDTRQATSSNSQQASGFASGSPGEHKPLAHDAGYFRKNTAQHPVASDQPGHKLRGRKPATRAPADLQLCGQDFDAVADSRGLEIPGARLRDEAEGQACVLTANRSGVVTQPADSLSPHTGREAGRKFRKNPIFLASSHDFSSLEKAHDDEDDITDSSLEEAEFIGVEGNSDLFLNLSSDSGDAGKQEYRNIVNNDKYRLFDEYGNRMDERDNHDNDDNELFERYSDGDEYDNDDCEPRDLNSGEQLFCCSMLEPITEEDSDDMTESSDCNDSSRSNQGSYNPRNREVEYNLEYEEKRRGIFQDETPVVKPIYSVKNTSNFVANKNMDILAMLNTPVTATFSRRPITRLGNRLRDADMQSAVLMGVNRGQASGPDYQAVTGSGAGRTPYGDEATDSAPSLFSAPNNRDSYVLYTNAYYERIRSHGSSVDRLSPTFVSLNKFEEKLGSSSDQDRLQLAGEERNVTKLPVFSVAKRNHVVPELKLEPCVSSADVLNSDGSNTLLTSRIGNIEAEVDTKPIAGQGLVSGLRPIPIKTKRPVSDGLAYGSKRRKSEEEREAFYRDRVVSEGGGVAFGEDKRGDGSEQFELVTDDGHLQDSCDSGFQAEQVHSSLNKVEPASTPAVKRNIDVQNSSQNVVSINTRSRDTDTRVESGFISEGGVESDIGKHNNNTEEVKSNKQLSEKVRSPVSNERSTSSQIACDLQKTKVLIDKDTKRVDSRISRKDTSKHSMDMMDGREYYSSKNMGSESDVSVRREGNEETDETEWEEEIIETFVLPMSHEMAIFRTLQSVKDLLDQRSAARRSELIPRDEEEEVEEAKEVNEESRSVTNMIEVEGHDEMGFEGDDDVTSGYRGEYDAVARMDRDLKEKLGFELNLDEFKTDEYNTESGWPIVRYIEKERFYVEDNGPSSIEYERRVHMDSEVFHDNDFNDGRGEEREMDIVTEEEEEESKDVKYIGDDDDGYNDDDDTEFDDEEQIKRKRTGKKEVINKPEYQDFSESLPTEYIPRAVYPGRSDKVLVVDTKEAFLQRPELQPPTDKAPAVLVQRPEYHSTPSKDRFARLSQGDFDSPTFILPPSPVIIEERTPYTRHFSDTPSEIHRRHGSTMRTESQDDTVRTRTASYSASDAYLYEQPFDQPSPFGSDLPSGVDYMKVNYEEFVRDMSLKDLVGSQVQDERFSGLAPDSGSAILSGNLATPHKLKEVFVFPRDDFSDRLLSSAHLPVAKDGSEERGEKRSDEKGGDQSIPLKKPRLIRTSTAQDEEELLGKKAAPRRSSSGSLFDESTGVLNRSFEENSSNSFALERLDSEPGLGRSRSRDSLSRSRSREALLPESPIVEFRGFPESPRKFYTQRFFGEPMLDVVLESSPVVHEDLRTGSSSTESTPATPMTARATPSSVSDSSPKSPTSPQKKGAQQMIPQPNLTMTKPIPPQLKGSESVTSPPIRSMTIDTASQIKESELAIPPSGGSSTKPTSPQTKGREPLTSQPNKVPTISPSPQIKESHSATLPHNKAPLIKSTSPHTKGSELVILQPNKIPTTPPSPQTKAISSHSKAHVLTSTSPQTKEREPGIPAHQGASTTPRSLQTKESDQVAPQPVVWTRVIPGSNFVEEKRSPERKISVSPTSSDQVDGGKASSTVARKSKLEDASDLEFADEDDGQDNVFRVSSATKAAPVITVASTSTKVAPVITASSTSAKVAPVITASSTSAKVAPVITAPSTSTKVAPVITASSTPAKGAPIITASSTPAKVAPVITAPSTPAKVAPVITAPSTPAKVAPVITASSTSAKVAPVITAPSTSTKVAPVITASSTPAKVAPIITASSTPAKVAPVITAPSTPAKVAPVITAPSTPAKVAPVITAASTPAKVAPVITAPSTPAKVAPITTAPSTPAKVAPVITAASTPAKVAPITTAPSTPAKVAPVITAPFTPAKVAPVITAPSTPAKVAPVITAPSTPAKVAPVITAPSTPAKVAPVITAASTPTKVAPVITAASTATKIAPVITAASTPTKVAPVITTASTPTKVDHVITTASTPAKVVPVINTTSTPAQIASVDKQSRVPSKPAPIKARPTTAPPKPPLTPKPRTLLPSVTSQDAPSTTTAANSSSMPGEQNVSVELKPQQAAQTITTTTPSALTPTPATNLPQTAVTSSQERSPATTSPLMSNQRETPIEAYPEATPKPFLPEASIQRQTFPVAMPPQPTTSSVASAKPRLAPKPRKSSISNRVVDVATAVIPERVSPTFGVDRREWRIELVTPTIERAAPVTAAEACGEMVEEVDDLDGKMDVEATVEENNSVEEIEIDNESIGQEEEDDDEEGEEEEDENEEENDYDKDKSEAEIKEAEVSKRPAQAEANMLSSEVSDHVVIRQSQTTYEHTSPKTSADSSFTQDAFTTRKSAPSSLPPLNASWAHSQFIPGSPQKPRSMREIKKRYKQPYKSVLTQEPTTPTSPKAAPFVLPENLITPSRIKIIQSRDRFLNEQNLLSDPFAREFAAHKEAMKQATSPVRDRKYVPKMTKNPNYRSQEQLEKIMYMINLKHGRSDSALNKGHVDCLHDDCILSDRGRREILGKAMSMDSLHADLYRQLQRFDSETDTDGGLLGNAYFPETNSDLFDLTFPFQNDQRGFLERPASMSELRHASDYTTISGASSGYFDPTGSKGKGRFSQRQHKKSKSLCTLETNLDDVGFATSPTSDGLQRVPSAHELRISKSLQKLNVPNWYKQSSLSKSGSCLLKYGSSSSMSSWAFPPSLLSSPCTTPSSTSNVVIKSRVQLPTSSRNLRSPRFASKSAPSTPSFMNQSQEEASSTPTPVKLPSEKMRTKDKPKALMPIPIVPFDKIRAMFETTKEEGKTPKSQKEESPAPVMTLPTSSFTKTQAQRPTLMSPLKTSSFYGDEANEAGDVIPKVIVSPTDPNVKSILKRPNQEKRYSDIRESPEADDEPVILRPVPTKLVEPAPVMVLSQAPTLASPQQPTKQQPPVKPPIKEKPIPPERPGSGKLKPSKAAKEEKPAVVSKVEQTTLKQQTEAPEERQPSPVAKSKGFSFFKSLRSSSSSSTEEVKDKGRKSPHDKGHKSPTSPPASADSSYDSPDAFPASPSSRLSPPIITVTADKPAPKSATFVSVSSAKSKESAAAVQAAPVLIPPGHTSDPSLLEERTTRAQHIIPHNEPGKRDIQRNTRSPDSVQETNLDDSIESEYSSKSSATTPESHPEKKKTWFPKPKFTKAAKSPEESGKVVALTKESKVSEMQSKFEIQQLSDEPRRVRSPVEAKGANDSFASEGSRSGYSQRESDRSRASASLSDSSRSVARETDLDRSRDSYASRSADRSRESDRDFRDSRLPERKMPVEADRNVSRGSDQASDRAISRDYDRGNVQGRRDSETSESADDRSGGYRGGRYSSSEDDRRGGSRERDYDHDSRGDPYRRGKEYVRPRGADPRDRDFETDRGYHRNDNYGGRERDFDVLDRNETNYDKRDVPGLRDRVLGSREGSLYSRESDADSRGGDLDRQSMSRTSGRDPDIARDPRLRRPSDNYEDTTTSRTSLGSGRSWQPKPRGSRGSESSPPKQAASGGEENSRTSKPSLDSNGTSSPYRYRVAGSAFNASRPNAVAGLNTPPADRHEINPATQPAASSGAAKSLKDDGVVKLWDWEKKNNCINQSLLYAGDSLDLARKRCSVLVFSDRSVWRKK